MPELPALGDFHFLRPLWLIGVVPGLTLFWVVRWRDDPTRAWRGVIAPHLLDHLVVGREGGARFRPIHLIVAILMLGSIGAAGPTWRREPLPFSEDKAPLVIAIELSSTMNAIDVAPTRLERAQQKIRDLLGLRAGARTALLAYAGSAHTVMPLTDDPKVLETYLMALGTDVMPLDGNDAGAALALARRLLAREEVPGSILFVTDGIAGEHTAAFAQHRASGGDAVLILGVGTSEGGPIRSGEGFATDAAGRRIVAKLDVAGLRDVAEAAGAFVATVTLDDRDVGQVQHRIQSHFEAAVEQDSSARWRDMGYFLSYPIVLLFALWFRRGWTVRSVLVLAVATLAPTQSAAAEPRFADLWLTPDQQGQRLFDAGRFAEAAEAFDDPARRGVACYRAEDWDCAIDAFALADSAVGYFNLGNAYAQRGDLELAVASYDDALERRPGWREASDNRSMVASRIPREPEKPEEEGEPGDPSFDPDEIRFDDKGKKGKEAKVEQQGLSDKEISEIWLRGLQTSPKAFLRTQFAIQASRGDKGQ